MRRIKRVTIGSAFKVGATVSALVWAVLGIPSLLCQGLALGLLNSTQQYSNANVPNVGSFGLTGGIIFFLVGIVLIAIGGGITGALYAFFYNLTAGMTGGLEVEVE